MELIAFWRNGRTPEDDELVARVAAECRQKWENNWRRYLDHWNKTITRLDLPDDVKFPLDTHDTPAQGHSQTAGPSQLRPQPRRRARAPLSLSSSDRDVVKFDDDQHPDDAEEEEEEDKGGKGKKRAKASGGPPSKHQKH
ncbi:hypothetical protein B0H14DRAFT_2578164 [Mycena olivaceomarginata]|nr:hypothetical protein B0H14DRAFT_2578164 [Mycena olivaceomarginata]